MLRNFALSVLSAVIFFTVSHAQTQFGELHGKVTNAETGETLPFVNVQLLLGGITKGGTTTDINGDYIIRGIPAGSYDLKASCVGFNEFIIRGYVISSNKISFQDIKLPPTVLNMTEVVITDYAKPLVDKDDGGVGRLDKKEIEKAATRSVGALVELTAGVQGGSVKGARSEGTITYVDGVRVIGITAVPQGSISEISTITSGIPAEYGDLTGGVVSIVTRGPSNDFSGGLEFITSEMLDPFGYDVLEGNLSGPLLSKKINDPKKQVKKQTILGFLLSANANYLRDPFPSPIGVWKLKDDVYDYLYEHPLSPSPNGIGFVPSAEYITKDDMEKVKTHIGVGQFSYNINGKLDFQPKDNINITAGGQIGHSETKGYSYYHSLFNYKDATYSQGLNNTYRGYVRFTQQLNFGGNSKDKKATLEKAYYTLMVDYTKIHNISQDVNHKDNFFNYGYLGKFERYSEPVYIYDTDTIDGRIEKANILLGYRDTLVTFEASDLNESTANYTKQLYELQSGRIPNMNTIQVYGGLRNGDAPGNVYSLWANIGAPTTSYSVNDVDQLRVTGAAAAAVKKHEFKIGFEYEQRLQAGYSVGATSLWTYMRQYMNSHLLQLDTRNPIPVYDADSNFLDTINYNRLNDGSQTTFDKNFRNYLISKGETDVYGNPINELSYINIDRYGPEVFKLSFFSPDELLGPSLISYTGYDYLGKKLKIKPSIDDFLNSNDRLIAPINPIYMAGYLQDQFVFKDIIFRLGVRVDRFDANQIQLKDKYSLYPTRSVGEVTEIGGNPVTHPGNIGPDYVVYVDNAFNPTEIIGYRNGDNWYDATGAEVSDPGILANKTSTGSIAPYLVETNEDNLKLTKESFEDYTPQIDVSPRIYFSFPISDAANFYANYDVCVQRPTAGLFTTIDDYYYLEQRGTSVLSNAALKPQRITKYELGFKQAVSRNSAISLNAYYSETRNLINVRMINQAYPRSYMTYDNIDFSTVKGFAMAYDLRRTKTNNVQLMGSYTLQFADGTGSNAGSQAGLIGAGQPNLRTPFPLDNDVRHKISASIDYRYGSDAPWSQRKYYGPRNKNDKPIFENTGVNFLINTISGHPYSKQNNVTESVGVGIRQSEVLKGTVNGSRYPWTFSINMKIDRDFYFVSKSRDKSKQGIPFYLNTYIWVQNLFDIRNIAYVYRYTGDPDDDGFLASSYGIKAIQEATYSVAFYDQYSVRVNAEGNYSTPRLIRFGAVLNF